ncbi:MAG TPA: glycerate kinase [Thiobacillaceae bacterium]|nr:glycerate kinase [Thiobacillaceae bacterium]
MRELLLAAFQAGLSAVDPMAIVPSHMPAPPRGHALVVGGGKAAGAMACAVEDHWPNAAPLAGLVVTRYQHSLPTRCIEVIEASHPLPDSRGAEAATRMLDQVRRLTPDDLLLVLLSGGGSSLLALPAEGIALKELRAVTKALLACGAPIQDINTVRKHLTRLSGGQLAAHCQAPIRALIISDVVGDDPTDIASGPCAPDPSSYADALAILAHYAIIPPPAVSAHLQRGLRREILDTPKPGDAVFEKVENRVIGSARQLLSAAEAYLHERGITVVNLGENVGESRELAQAHARLIRDRLQSMPRPFALLSGGETTVIVRNPAGRGGRNTEYLLALGLALKGIASVWGLACDTDGIDGTEENAGARWQPDSLARSQGLGLDAQNALAGNNAYAFFQALDDLVITGPTRTNVNDFRLVLIVDQTTIFAAARA